MENKQIKTTLQLAIEQGLTYGQYVAKYGVPNAPPKKEAARRCTRCGADISRRNYRAKYCEECARSITRRKAAGGAGGKESGHSRQITQ